MRVTVIPIVAGVLGTVPKGLEKLRMMRFKIRGSIETFQTTELLKELEESWRISRKNNHESVESWRVDSASEGKTLSKVKIQRSIFYADSLSSQLFIIVRMHVNYILRKRKGGYKLTKSQEKINYFMQMDDIKMFVKNKKEIEILIKVFSIYSKDTGMELGIEKCIWLKREKRNIGMNGTASSGKNQIP